MFNFYGFMKNMKNNLFFPKMIKFRNLALVLRTKTKIQRLFLAEFSNFHEKQEKSNPQERIIKESLGKYEEICAKEKERINNFGQKTTKKEYLNAQMTRFIFLTFAIVANIFILGQIYNILWKFYSPYKNEPSASKNEKKT